MERLTQYFEVGNYTEKQNIIDVSDKLPLFENGVIMGKAIDRLAEFEDFMEENEFYDLQSLKDTLYQANMELYKMKTLKDRSQRLKEYIKENMEDDNNPEEEWCVLHRVLKKMQELENGE